MLIFSFPIVVAVMNFPPFGGHFPSVHQFAAAKFSNDQIQAGTMLVTSSSDGSVQYIRPEHNGANFLAANSNSNAVQGISVSIPTPVNIPVSMASRGIPGSQQGQPQQQQHLTAAGNKYHPHSTFLGWGEVPIMHHFNDGSKNIATINVPYPNPNMSSAAILAVQPTPSSGAPTVWPVRIMQNVSTMTELQPKELGKPDEDAKSKSDIIKREKDSGESDDDSDDSSKSDTEGPSSTSEPEQNHTKLPVSQGHPLTNGSGLECHQIQLQQQGSAMADYLARLQPTTIPLSLQHFIKFQSNNAAAAAVAAVSEGRRENEVPVGVHENSVPYQNNRESQPSQKKKKKKKTIKPPRPKPGEIRLSTALDGSMLFCCPDCYMAYPDKEMLEQHLVGHKQERRFVCNVCGACLKRKEHLDQHKRGHSEERPYVCNICMKGFKRNEHLTRHFVIHSGNKNHTCVECGKAFSRKDHLHKHTQTHIAKRVKAELSQAASLENTPSPAPVSTPPVTMNIPHVIPLHHSLQLHHGMS